MNKKVDLGIVIALREEFRELFNEIGDHVVPLREESTGRYQFFFQWPAAGSGEPYQCVATFIGDMGPVDAALVTQDLLITCKPKTIVMLGIAAGIHKDVRIGDVVYAKQVDGYIESAKAEATAGKENFKLAPGGSVYRCSEEFIHLLDNFEFVHRDAYDLWRSQCALDLESLITEAERNALISAALLRDSVVLDGVHMASGPILGSSSTFTKWLHDRDRTLKALEMEAYGFVKAVFNRLKASSTIVLRGISDFGDERKKELDKIGEGALRRYAVRNALRLLWALLSVGGLPKHPTRKSKKTTGKGSSTSAILNQVHRLSSVAARDAGFIIDDPGGHPSGEIRLEQDLYVNRSIEGVIYGLFDTRPEDDPPFVVVVGEAGFGKTSLLWQLHRTMVRWDRWQPWFIKSTFLIGQSSDDGRRLSVAKPNLSVEQLQLAAFEVQTQGKRPIILLDTADLLLGNENDRFFLIDTLLSLKEHGGAIIMATRPQEAVYLRSLEDVQRVDLRDYNDGELEEAVSKHVARFYENTGVRHLSEHVERIQNAVASGLPVHDVCKNPLTLRMLYTLYAPEAVPLEINAFKLYENFWDMRVAKDHRAGSPCHQHGTDDLTRTASAMALIMLAEGSPEIDNRLVKSILADMDGSEMELKQLVSRGIIHQSEGRTIRFFHQTFFEHSAARGLLARFRADSINILEGRMRERPNDLFINPVFEHLLLLCESQPAPVRLKAENAFKQLLCDTSLLARSSAIYVYAHQQKISEECIRSVQNVLPSEETAIITRFLNIAHNMPHPRLRNLLEHLDAIWERCKWEEQYDVLELLERLAARTPNQIMAYLYRHKIFEMINEMPPLGYQSLFKTLVILAGRDSSLCDDQNVQIMIDTLVETRNRNLQISILDTLRELTKSSAMKLIPEKFEGVLRVKSFSMDDLVAVQGFGCLFAEGWRLSRTPLTEILPVIKDMDGLIFKVWLYGLAELLLIIDIDEAQAEMVWQYYRDEPNVFRQWQWSNVVLPRLLRGRTDFAASSGKSETVVRYFRDRVAKLIAEETDAFDETEGNEGNTTRISMLYTQAKSAIIYARLPAKELLDLLKCKPLDSARLWLSENGLANLLAEAYSAGHPGAASAMQLMIQAPNKYPIKVVSVVATGLAQLPNAGEEVLESTIRLLVNTDKAGGLHRFLESNSGLSSEFMKKLEPELTALRERLVRSSSGAKRRQGVWLWSYLLRMGLDAPPSISELLSFMSRESDQQTYAWFALLFGPASVKGGYDTEKVMEVLLPMCISKDENLREKAMEGLFEAVIHSNKTPEPFSERLLEGALSRPTNANRLSQIGILIESLIPKNSELAVILSEKLLTAPEVAELGHQAKRWLITRLRQPIRSLFRSSPSHLLERLLNIIPQVDSFIGRILVDAACHDTFFETVQALDRLLDHPDVDGKVKELIRRHKHLRERTKGGGSWPELYKVQQSCGFSL